MGIILSVFEGLKVDPLKNSCQVSDLRNNNSFNNSSDESKIELIMELVNSGDIVIVNTDTSIRKLLDGNELDFDIFYPSENRKIEIINNLVVERIKPDYIKKVDLNFIKRLKAIENSNFAHEYKHLLSSANEYVYNNSLVNSYISSIVKPIDKVSKSTEDSYSDKLKQSTNILKNGLQYLADTKKMDGPSINTVISTIIEKLTKLVDNE